MAIRYAFSRHLSIALTALLAAPLAAQVLVDDFNRANSNTVGGGWTETETSAPTSCQISANELLEGSSTSGADFVARSTPGTYNTVLTSNTCNMTWAFNMRQSRSDPSGFNGGGYGIAVVLAGTNADLNQGNGYAVVLGNGGATDPLRFVRYTNGLDGNANIQTLLSVSDFGANYLDVRVTYNPTTDQWSLFYRDNGTGGPFGDPLTASTSGGSTIDVTYTGVSTPNIGCYWNHGTSATDNARFDNFYVPNPCNATTVQFTGASSTVSETGVSTTLTVSITNPSGVNATTANVVLTAGTASRINNYTTQTLTFPAGSSASQTVTISLTDNGACDGTEVFTFQLQSVAGGTSATAGSPSIFSLTVTDNELSTDQLLARQAFDGLITDTWPITSGAGNVSAASGAGDNPANQRILSGSQSWQVNNGNVTLNLGTLDVSAYNNVVIRARVSSVSVNPSNGADAGDNVRFFVNLNGAGFPATADLTVTGNSNARWGYSSGTGTATATAGTPASFAPAAGGDRTTDGYSNIVINIPGGTSTIALRAIALNNDGNEVWALENVEVRGDLCRPIYYSRASGSQNTASWSTTRTGVAGAVTFNQNATAVVQTGHTVTAAASTWTVYNLTVESGGSVVMGTVSLDHYGTALTNNNSFTTTTGAVTFRNPGAVTLGGSATYDLYDLTANNADVTLTTSLLRIRRTLDMTNGGTFNANNSGNPARVLELNSDANGTGRIGPMSAGPSFTGQITMERYVPGGVTNWRLISAPTNNNTLSSLEDDFVTAGYPGSQFPAFDSPPGSNILWPSIRTYNESNAGAALTDGLTGATGDNMVMGMGQGFAAWSGTTLTTTVPFTIDLRSSARNGITPLNLPVTFTNTGNSAVDGWNLVGNPVPSPIDWSLLSRTNVDNFYYVFDPVSGNNAAWDEGLGLSIPSGALNGNIQSFQGFWVKANGASPALSVEENDKVLDLNGGGLFGGNQSGAQPMFRLELTSAMNSFRDEALVHFGTGTPASGDAHDLVKFTFSHPEAPQIMSRTSDGRDVTLNAWGEITSDISIEVPIDVGMTGTYTVRVFDAMGIMGQTCLVLEDLQTGQSITLSEGATYSFTADANDPVLPARFVVHATAPVQHILTNVSCQGATDGSATAIGAGTGPWDYTWASDDGTVLFTQSQENGAGQIGQLPAGDYLVTVSSNSGCGALTHAFRIDEPAALDATLAATATTCSVAVDGAIDLAVMGGTGPYTYAWSNGASSEDLTGLAAGAYAVSIVDANGCSFQTTTINVTDGSGPGADFLPSTTAALIGEPIAFFNLGTWGADVEWDLGDGTTTTEVEPTHTYTVPGTYTVTLTTTVGACSASTSQQVVIDATTGIAPPKEDLARVWLDNEHVVVDLAQQRADEVVITVLDGAGRVVAERRSRLNAGRERIPVDHVAGGVILVRLLTNSSSRTYRLPLAR